MASPQKEPERGPAGKTLAALRESVVAPAIDAVQRSPVYALTANTIDVARAISNSPGAAPLHAAVRQGADEIAQVLTAFPANGIQPVSEMGQLFEPTPAEADRQLTGRSLSDLREYAARATERAGQEMGKSSLERDNGRGM